MPLWLKFLTVVLFIATMLLVRWGLHAWVPGLVDGAEVYVSPGALLIGVLAIGATAGGASLVLHRRERKPLPPRR